MRLAALFLLLGCGEKLEPVEGTTARVGPEEQEPVDAHDLALHIFRDASDCGTYTQETDTCVPWVDRAAGQVRVAFRLELDGTPYPTALTAENVEVVHKGQQVKAEGDSQVEIIPHHPEETPRMFVLLLDGSGSMAIDDEGRGQTRMDLVRSALTRRDVVEAFFPVGGDNVIVPLVFAGSGPPRPLGGVWVVKDRADWNQLVLGNLGVSPGYTYLYQAVAYATSTLFEITEVRQVLTARARTPVVIALTDGFNNEGPDDICASNVRRLEGLLEQLDEVRRGSQASLERRPAVYTVGLGRAAWRDRAPPEGTSVRTSELCRSLANVRIDGELERAGVDNIALRRISQVGGGATYIRRDARGLADAFKAAAATRYEWFEARYRVDPFHLRREFDTQLRVLTAGQPESSIAFRPSGWFDGPPGVVGGEGWTRPASVLAVTAFAVPLIALLLVIAYLPAAVVNASRHLRGRVRL